jgi:hypothetical protein
MGVGVGGGRWEVGGGRWEVGRWGGGEVGRWGGGEVEGGTWEMVRYPHSLSLECCVRALGRWSVCVAGPRGGR